MIAKPCLFKILFSRKYLAKILMFTCVISIESNNRIHSRKLSKKNIKKGTHVARSHSTMTSTSGKRKMKKTVNVTDSRSQSHKPKNLQKRRTKISDSVPHFLNHQKRPSKKQKAHSIVKKLKSPNKIVKDFTPLILYDRDLQVLLGAGLIAITVALGLNTFVSTVLTKAPTTEPSNKPVGVPSFRPTTTRHPTRKPSQSPSHKPSAKPTKSALPSMSPTGKPTKRAPSSRPSRPANALVFFDQMLGFLDSLWYSFFLSFVE